ncbi:MAG: type II secretory pathway component PulF, partial [Planctomycetota bacterium]
MTTFNYAAKGPGGQTVEGQITAESKAEAVAELRGKNLMVMRLDAAK